MTTLVDAMMSGRPIMMASATARAVLTQEFGAEAAAVIMGGPQAPPEAHAVRRPPYRAQGTPKANREGATNSIPNDADSVLARATHRPASTPTRATERPLAYTDFWKTP